MLRLRLASLTMASGVLLTMSGCCSWCENGGLGGGLGVFRSAWWGGRPVAAMSAADCDCHHSHMPHMPQMQHMPHMQHMAGPVYGPTLVPSAPPIMTTPGPMPMPPAPPPTFSPQPMPIPITNVPSAQATPLFKVPQAPPTAYAPTH